MPYWNGAVYQSMLDSLCSGRVIDGADLDDLRSRLVQELAVEDALLCGSGSLALEIALRACKVERGDEVVIPTFCCTAVVAPILATGATPVLADVGEELNLTVGTVRAVLTQKTRAIIVPHLFGNPADIEGIAELAARKNIRVIDDAAQALGATIHGRPVGSFGAAGILSFGNEKVCFGLGGGMAIFRDKKVLPSDLQLHLDPAQVFAHAWQTRIDAVRVALAPVDGAASEIILGAATPKSRVSSDSVSARIDGQSPSSSRQEFNANPA